MRLRRSDFALWDYPKRATWRCIKFALRCRGPHGELKESDSDTLAWALKRANDRATWVIGQRATFLSWLVAVGTVATEAEAFMGHQARAAVERIRRTTEPEKAVWLQSIVSRLAKS